MNIQRRIGKTRFGRYCTDEVLFCVYGNEFGIFSKMDIAPVKLVRAERVLQPNCLLG